MVVVNQRLTNKLFKPLSDENSISQPIDSTWRFTLRPSIWQPPTDVFETKSELIIRVEIAGMRDSTFNVRVDQNHLSISGVRSDSQEPKGFHQMEIAYGEFQGEINLAVFVDIDKVHAEYDDGFLIINLPKINPTKITLTD